MKKTLNTLFYGCYYKLTKFYERALIHIFSIDLQKLSKIVKLSVLITPHRIDIEVVKDKIKFILSRILNLVQRKTLLL